MGIRLTLWRRRRSPSQAARRSASSSVSLIPGEEHVLEEEALVALELPGVERLAQPGEVPGAVDRHGGGARGVGGGVQGDGELRPGIHPRQPLDAGDEPGGAHRDAPGREEPALRAAEDGDGAVDVVEVVERLAHPHEDEVEVLAAAAVPGRA